MYCLQYINNLEPNLEYTRIWQTFPILFKYLIETWTILRHDVICKRCYCLRLLGRLICLNYVIYIVWCQCSYIFGRLFYSPIFYYKFVVFYLEIARWETFGDRRCHMLVLPFHLYERMYFLEYADFSGMLGDLRAYFDGKRWSWHVFDIYSPVYLPECTLADLTAHQVFPLDQFSTQLVKWCGMRRGYDFGVCSGYSGRLLFLEGIRHVNYN